MKELTDRVRLELLPFVGQPGQYIGREINQLVEPGDWQAADLRVAVAFPDTYAIGMSHLGCQIIYWIINHTEGCCAERVYCPAPDAESLMRHKKIELFTWDTRQPVSSADILAVSLQHEMAYTSMLQLLDLSDIPLRAAQRDDRHPLVIAGGPQADNPEPVAPFLDLVVLGDGEDSTAAIIQAAKELKADNTPRREMIEALAKRFEWIYAPALYDVSCHSDGTIESIVPACAGIPESIRRCGTRDFDAAPFPERPLVPHVEVVHDRMAVEIMRGCPRRCRFCHAGHTKRPIRVRSVATILDLAEKMYRATGMDELGLLSLSTGEYPQLRELAERINERFAPRRVNISLPSLRIDKMLQDIPWMAGSVRKSGLTMAIEAASQDMREAIHKTVTKGDLLDGVRQAYAAGWHTVKLYFMCGFPGERPEDIDGIVHVARQVSEIRRELGKGPARVNASVGWLVPKPHTPMQWSAQATAEYFHEARIRLQSLLWGTAKGSKKKKGGVRIKTHLVERSILEGVFARGDRRLADAIEHAYRAGARFDSWDEHFRADVWTSAFTATGIDPAWYAHRERGRDEIFPWSHLQGGPSREHLQCQYDDIFVRLGIPRPPG